MIESLGRALLLVVMNTITVASASKKRIKLHIGSFYRCEISIASQLVAARYYYVTNFSVLLILSATFFRWKIQLQVTASMDTTI